MCVCFHISHHTNEYTENKQRNGFSGVVEEILEYVDNVERIKKKLTLEELETSKFFLLLLLCIYIYMLIGL